MLTRLTVHVLAFFAILALSLGCGSSPYPAPEPNPPAPEPSPPAPEPSPPVPDVGEFDAEVQRRFLDLVNRANRADELAVLESAGVDKAAAEQLIARRGPYGYRSLAELRAVPFLELELFPGILDLFGPRFFGSWKLLPYNVQRPDGSLFSTAHASMLRSGRVLFFPNFDSNQTLLWDPTDEVNPTFTFPSNLPSATPARNSWLFCSGHTFLGDGRLLTVGGGGNSSGNATDRGWLFDPIAESWASTGANMAHRRWYPTAVNLGDGRVLVAAGLGGTGTDELEIYDPSSDSFSAVTGPNAKRNFPEAYPGLHLIPNGEIVYTRTGWGHGLNDATTLAELFRFTGASSGEWVQIASPMNSFDRTEGMSVQLISITPPHWRVMVIGGGDPAATGRGSAEILNMWVNPPTWAHPKFMPEDRKNVNAVMLPDSNVFVLGGRPVQNSPSLMFNPTTDTWSTMATLKYRREYHSVALLLPSGKVMTTGGDFGNTQSEKTTIEIFSPPYLFRGARPQISQVADRIRYDTTFELKTPAAASIQKVVLVRPMAVTHQTAPEQRVVQLYFTRYGDTLTVTAPRDAGGRNLAPPGYYMLFILNDKGVPSEARFVQLYY